MEVSPDVQRQRGDTPDQDEVGEERDEVVLGPIGTVDWHIASGGGGATEGIAGETVLSVIDQ